MDASGFSELFAGLRGTLSLAAIAWAAGAPIALIAAFYSGMNDKFQNTLSSASMGITILPFLVILFWIHYPLQGLLGLVWPPYWTTAALLTIYITIAGADILSTAMANLRKNYEDSATVLGITELTFLRKVVFPAALELSIPRLLLLAVTSVHITMFSSLIGVEELFRATLRLNAELLKPVELFSIMALLYAMLCVPLYALAIYFKRRLSESM